MGRRRWMLLALALAAGAHCTPACADGDPASDYLLSQQVFLLSQSSHAPTASQRRLRDAVRAANGEGFHIRVALISNSYDLGSVTQLWRRPQTYARFLGIELSLAYKGRLLVVMPNGFGFNWPGHSRADAERTLAGIAIRQDAAGEVQAATLAVRRLAAAAGTSLPSVSSAPSAGPGSALGLALLAGAALAFALALGVGLALRRRGSERAPASSQAPPAVAVTRSRRMRYALPAAATLLVVVAGVPVIALSAHSAAPSAPPRQEAHGPGTPFTWPAGQRRAPQLRLTDQNGGPVSLAAFRGRPVIVTFVDPLCRRLCPLEAHVLNRIDSQLPVSQRPEIVAVSVDVYADTRKDLLQDYRRWGLVPQWHWAVGTPSQLESVWRRYYAEVTVETKHIAGTTVHYITHSEMSYLVDPSGYERALFVWPFKAADVERTLRQLSRS